MKPWDSARGMLRKVGLLLALTLGLAGCGMGEPVMPNPPTGVPADRSVGVVVSVPAPIPHTLEGRAACFTCHAIGAVDAPPVPAGHVQDTTSCTTCHAVWLAPAIAAAAPPAIPHGVEGRGDCLVCHKLGTGEAPRVPDNHDGLTSDICQTCHTAIGEIAGAGEGQEVPRAEIPSIPHGLQGFEACTQCHEKGGPGIPRFPDDHKGRTDDICTACHSPTEGQEAATPTVRPTVTPTGAPAEVTATQEPTAATPGASPTAAGDVARGQVLYAARCAICHGPEGEGASVAPDALNNAALLTRLTDEDLTTVIRGGVAGKMPAFTQLSGQEVLDLIAFLRSWQ
jgi:cytochrome c5